MVTSRTTSAGGDSNRRRSAVRPSGASSTTYPARESTSRSRPRMSASSSTTRRRAGSLTPFSYRVCTSDASNEREGAALVARILIVEPHADLRTLLDLVVRRLGHEPVVQGPGEDDPADLDAGVIEVG